MQIVNESAPCLCSNAQSLLETNYDSPKTSQNKYFHEIEAEMLGNQLIIRVEKDKNKNKKKQGQWDPPCDCDMVEIQRPAGKEGPKIVNAGDNNQILFRIHSKNHLNSKDDQNYKPQAIAYKVGPTKGADGSDNCRTITVHPQLGGPGTQEVFSDHITEGNEDIFLLKIKKKSELDEHVKRNVEVELRTPKPPTPPPPPPPVKSPPPKVEEKPPASTETKKGKKGKQGKGGKKKK